jgi:hypothetical protein
LERADSEEGVIPTAYITAPEEHSVVCGDLTLFGTESVGSLNRQLEYKWNLSKSGSDLGMFNSFSVDYREIVITSGLSGQDANLRAELTVRNFLGETDSTFVDIVIRGQAILSV